MKITYRRMAGAIFILIACLTATVEAQPAPPTNPPSGPGPGSFLNSWSFNDTNWLTDSGYAPLSFTNLTLEIGRGDVNSLLMDTGGDPSFVLYNTVETTGRTNLNCQTGTISLWFAADWSGTNAGGTGPGSWSRFVEAGTNTTNASIGWFSFYLSPDGCTVFLAGQTNNGNGGIFLSAPVTITNGVWNSFIVTYGPTNSAFYFNGALVTNSPNGVAYYPDPGVLTNGFSLGSSAVDGQSQIQGMLDDVATFDYQWDTNIVFLTYQLYYQAFYGTPVVVPELTNAPSGPTNAPTFKAITGAGDLVFVGTNSSGCVTSSNIWITNIVASLSTNQTVNVTFTIEGGSNNVLYDVFGATGLANPISSGQWVWLGQGYHCSTYTLPIQSNSVAYFLLGQPTDTDHDGLTDAYELLVSKTNPNDSGFNADGIPEAWAAMQGLSGTNLANLDPDSDGLSNMREYLYGTKPLTPEGLAIWVASPAGGSGIP